MFLDVTWSSLKSLQLCVAYIRNIISFTSASSKKYSIKWYNQQSAMDNSFNQSRSILIMIIAMSVGEFQATSSNFDSIPMTAYLFLGFPFLISTVFMNFMNGFAVSDTSKIQADAKTTILIQRVQVLAYYEGVKQHWFR